MGCTSSKHARIEKLIGLDCQAAAAGLQKMGYETLIIDPNAQYTMGFWHGRAKIYQENGIAIFIGIDEINGELETFGSMGQLY